MSDYDHGPRLMSYGLLNHDQEDWGVLAMADPRRTMGAFCQSHTCCYDPAFGLKKQVRKHVDGTATVCPQCGFALLWKDAKVAS